MQKSLITKPIKIHDKALIYHIIDDVTAVLARKPPYKIAITFLQLYKILTLLMNFLVKIAITFNSLRLLNQKASIQRSF